LHKLPLFKDTACFYRKKKHETNEITDEKKPTFHNFKIGDFDFKLFKKQLYSMKHVLDKPKMALPRTQEHPTTIDLRKDIAMVCWALKVTKHLPHGRPSPDAIPLMFGRFL
jgi:hypothetical protein